MRAIPKLRQALLSVGVAVLAARTAMAAAVPQDKAPPATTTPRKPARPGPGFDELSRHATAAREANRVDEAIRLYRQAVRERPRWDEGWWYLATLLYEADRHADGREAFRRFLGLKPEVAAAWALRGLCDYGVGDYEAALQHLDKGLQLGLSDRPEILRVARFHQALLLVKAGQFELALQPLTLLSRAEPESVGIVEAIGLMILRNALLPSEIPEARRALVRLAGRAGYFHLARKGDEAARAFATLVESYPAEPWVHYAHGVALLTSDPDKGLAELRRETEIQPDAVFPHLEIAFELLRRGDNEAARAAAERSVQIAPGLFAAHNALGRVLVELGELEKGIAELETAVHLADDSPEMYFSLARAYAKAGRKEDAERTRATFTELDRKRRAQRGEPTAAEGGTP